MAGLEVLFTGDAVSPDDFSQTAYIILHANIGPFLFSLRFCFFRLIPFGNLSCSLGSISFSVFFYLPFFYACPSYLYFFFFLSLSSSL